MYVTVSPRQWYARTRRVLQAHSPVLSHELGPFLEDATWDEITLRARIQAVKSLQEMCAELGMCLWVWVYIYVMWIASHHIG